MANASDQTPLKASDQTEAKRRSGPETLVLYQAIVLKGEHELKRPAKSLFWSGLAAGIAISTSLIAEAALFQHLPDAPWRELITAFGYSVGFVIVILGRLQLFTEHTVVSLVPVVASPGLSNLDKLARLWGIVFVTNEFGVFLASLAFAKFGLASPDLLQAMIDVSKPMLDKDFLFKQRVWLLKSVRSISLSSGTCCSRRKSPTGICSSSSSARSSQQRPTISG